MKTSLLAFVASFAFGSLLSAQVIVPMPRAYYSFEEGIGDAVTNVVNPGVFDASLGTTTGTRPLWVAGLNGSNHALQAKEGTTTNIVRISSLITDTNADRHDEDVFSNSFTVFARVSLVGPNQTGIVSADRPNGGSTTNRGWYLDFTGNTAATFKARFTMAGTPLELTVTLADKGITYNDINDYGAVFKAASAEGVKDGRITLYINGASIGSMSHDYTYANVGEQGVSIGFHGSSNWFAGNTIDDVAIWDLALDADEMAQVHSAIVIPEPQSAALLLGVAASGIILAGRRAQR